MSVNEKMKDSGVEWIGKIPEGWSVGRLKDLFFTRGGSGAIKNTCFLTPDEIEGLFPAFSASGQDVWVSKSTFKEKGIVLSAVGARCGKTFLSEFDLWDAIANTQSIFPKSRKALGLKYFWFLTNSEDFWLTGGTAQPFVQTAKTFEKLISLPPLAEQKAIADFLDRETGLIDKRLALIEKRRGLLKELRKSVVHEAVTKGLEKGVALKDSGVEWIGEIPAGWCVTRMKSVCSINPNTSIPNEISELCFFPMDAIGVDGGMFSEEKKSLNSAGGYSICKNGDVVFAKVTPCFENGKSSIVQNIETEVALATTEISVLRPNKKIRPDFLHYRLKGFDFRHMGESEMKGAGGLKRVPERHVASFIFCLPPLAEQKAIAEFLDRETAMLDKMLSLMDRQEALLKEQRKALVHEVVTGKLRVI